MFLFLHSQEGKKCFHDCAKIILRIAGVFSAIQNKSSRATVFTLSVFQLQADAQLQAGAGAQATSRGRRAGDCCVRAGSSQSTMTKVRSPRHATSRRWGAKRGRLGAVAGYELRSMCARNSAIEPNLTVPSGSLASIEPSV